MTDTKTKTTTALNGSGWPAALRSPLVLGLAALLGLQLFLAALGSGDNRLAPAASETPLAEFEPEQIDRLEILTPASEHPLVLTRAGEDWVIPALGDFPADSARIDQLLETLASLKRPLPIATSASARERFKVDEQTFEQQIVLKHGKERVATLLLGDSPGFRRRYLSPLGDDGVYDLRFEVFNLSDQSKDWIARDRLRLPRDQIQALAADGWTLSRDGETWSLTGDGAQEAGELDPDKIEQLLDTLADLSYREVLGTEAPEDFDSAARLELAIRLDGASRRYLIAARSPAADDDGAENYVLKSDTDAHYFLLSAFDLGPLAALDVSALTKPVPPQNANPANSSPAAEAEADQKTPADDAGETAAPASD